MAASPSNNALQVVGETPLAPQSELSVVGETPLDSGAAPHPGAPLTFGNTLGGLAQLAAGGLANIPYGAAHAVQDLTRRITGGDPNAPDNRFVQALEVKPGAMASNLVQGISELPAAQAVGSAVKAADTKLGEVSPTAQDILHHAGSVAGDVLNLAPAVGVATGAAKGIGGALAARAAAKEAALTPAQQAGFVAPQGTVARALAGSSGGDALTLQNQKVSNIIGASEAGHVGEAPLGYDATKAARGAPEAIYDRVAGALPTGALDDTAVQDVMNVGSPSGGRISAGTPQAQAQIAKLKEQLTAPGSVVTGRQIVNEVKGLRQEGFANIASDDVSNQQLGRAQLDMSRALEGHIERNLPEGSEVSSDQFKEARQALAKNYAVQGALRGSNVDAGAIARLQRADPGLLTGGLKAIADFANEYPTVSGLGSRIENPPSFAYDLMGDRGHSLSTVISPSWLTGVVGGRALGRRLLTGSEDTALARANRMFPQRSPDAFARLPFDLQPAAGRVGPNLQYELPFTTNERPSAPAAAPKAPAAAPKAPAAAPKAPAPKAPAAAPKAPAAALAPEDVAKALFDLLSGK